jgi:hypothetical protein
MDDHDGLRNALDVGTSHMNFRHPTTEVVSLILENLSAHGAGSAWVIQEHATFPRLRLRIVFSNHKSN